MDGVIINNNSVWATYFNSMYEVHNHRELHPGGSPATWDYVYDLCSECFAYCINTPSLIDHAPLVDGLRSGLEAISKESDLYVVSHRGAEVIPACYAMLEKNDLMKYFKGTSWSFDNKVTTCLSLGCDVLIDDAPKNCEAARDSGKVTPVLLSYPYNEHVTGVRVGRDWGMVAEIHTKLRSEVSL